jgi:hypothetical protein
LSFTQGSKEVKDFSLSFGDSADYAYFLSNLGLMIVLILRGLKGWLNDLRFAA